MDSQDKRRLPAHIRRQALDQLSRDRLSEFTDKYHLSVEDRRLTEQHIKAIVRSRSVDFIEILEALTRDELKDICYALGLDDSGREKTLLVERIMALAEEESKSAEPKSAIADSSVVEREEPSANVESTSRLLLPEKASTRVFIIHGREKSVLQQLKHFLKSLGLQAWTFDDENHEALPNTHAAEIVSRGVSKTKAVIALLTPDEYACLVPTLRQEAESERNIRRWQPRPNVIYEAGMAMALNRTGTILVTIGHVELPSDLDGILHIRLSNSIDSRRNLRKKLIQAGCAVDLQMEEWMDSAQGGDFGSLPVRAFPSDPFSPA